MLNINTINTELRKVSFMTKVRAIIKQLEQVKYTSEDVKSIAVIQMYNQINR